MPYFRGGHSAKFIRRGIIYSQCLHSIRQWSRMTCMSVFVCVFLWMCHSSVISLRDCSKMYSWEVHTVVFPLDFHKIMSSLVTKHPILCSLVASVTCISELLYQLYWHFDFTLIICSFTRQNIMFLSFCFIFFSSFLHSFLSFMFISLNVGVVHSPELSDYAWTSVFVILSTDKNFGRNISLCAFSLFIERPNDFLFHSLFWGPPKFI